MLGVAADDVHRVSGPRTRPRRAAGTHEQSGRNQVTQRRRERRGEAAGGFDERAEYKWRLATDRVGEVADGQVEQQLGERRCRHNQPNAVGSQADPLCKEGEDWDDGAHGELQEERRCHKDAQLKLSLAVEPQRRRRAAIGGGRSPRAAAAAKGEERGRLPRTRTSATLRAPAAADADSWREAATGVERCNVRPGPGTAHEEEGGGAHGGRAHRRIDSQLILVRGPNLHVRGATKK